LTDEFNLWFTSPMPAKTPKFRNRGESQHWSLAKAAVLNRWNWPAKRKANVDYVNKLADEIADTSLASYRIRVGSNGK
jgi:hypothetical protein